MKPREYIALCITFLIDTKTTNTDNRQNYTSIFNLNLSQDNDSMLQIAHPISPTKYKYINLC